MTGAGIMLISGGVPRGSLCSTNEVSDLLEHLQFDLGEGPSVDAHHQDAPVLEPDLVHPKSLRWLAFRVPALDAGVRAVFGFPMQVGVVRLGALNLYRDVAGPLTDDQHADALVMATIAAQAVLVLQADAPLGGLATAFDEGAEFRFVVHQAAGMVAAQLEVSVELGLVRLRAHAFGDNRTLTDVAKDVVERRLRFEDRFD